MAMKFKLTVFFLIVQIWGFAQKIENIAFEMDGENVKIHYTLIGEFPEQNFEVKIYTSVDKFVKPLEQVKGDVNRKNITPGKKEVVWEAKKEYTLFEGDISFKIIATVVSNYWISAPTKGDILKKGRVFDVAWEGFRPGTAVRITAHYPNGKTEEIASGVTGKSYRWKIKGKPGKGAYIRVTDVENNNAFAKSGNFTIKRKMPLAAQVGIAAVATGAIIFYILRPEQLEPLPYPPGPSK
jgi:hypothetical protein